MAQVRARARARSSTSRFQSGRAELDKVVILFKHHLFANGIVRLLANRGLIIETVDGRDADAIAELKAMEPDLVLVEDDDQDAVFAARLTELWAETPGVGVIRIPIQSNQLAVYSSRRINADGTDDLLSAIKLLGRCAAMQPETGSAPIQ